LDIIINDPDAQVINDAIKYKKIGNSAVEEYPEAIFYGAYASIHDLIKTPVYQEAFESDRLRFFITDMYLGHSIFNIQYKDDYQDFNHVKIDLYYRYMKPKFFVQKNSYKCDNIFQAGESDEIIIYGRL